MKLKKIASLALAGVMAVSMLAGCATANVEPEQPEKPETPATSAAADALYSELTGSAKEKVTAVADADLDSALDNAVAKYWNYGSMLTGGPRDEVFQDEIERVNYQGVVDYRETRIGAAVKDAVKANYLSIASEHHNYPWNGIDGSLFSCKTDANNRKAVEIWAVPASVSDAMALEIVAEKIDRFVSKLPVEGGYNQDDYTTESDNKPNYDFSYSISASIATKTVNIAGLEQGIKYVAVMMTKTVAEKG